MTKNLKKLWGMGRNSEYKKADINKEIYQSPFHMLSITGADFNGREGYFTLSELRGSGDATVRNYMSDIRGLVFGYNALGEPYYAKDVHINGRYLGITPHGETEQQKYTRFSFLGDALEQVPLTNAVDAAFKQMMIPRFFSRSSSSSSSIPKRAHMRICMTRPHSGAPFFADRTGDYYGYHLRDGTFATPGVYYSPEEMARPELWDTHGGRPVRLPPSYTSQLPKRVIDPPRDDPNDPNDSFIHVAPDGTRYIAQRYGGDAPFFQSSPRRDGSSEFMGLKFDHRTGVLSGAPTESVMVRVTMFELNDLVRLGPAGFRLWQVTGNSYDRLTRPTTETPFEPGRATVKTTILIDRPPVKQSDIPDAVLDNFVTDRVNIPLDAHFTDPEGLAMTWSVRPAARAAGRGVMR